MTLTIIALTPKEEYLQVIDPDLCEIKETIQANGLRTIDFTYKFQDYTEDKQLFKLGNKLWIQGDINLTDCLYVVNTTVKQDIYKENSFTFDAEEVLVELNNAPLVSHLDVTTYSSVFKEQRINGAQQLKIDWNALNYFFGEFFNIGVVQDCLNRTIQWIPFFGTFNLMNLLRYIEEQTGNVFVTRYEKDNIDNTIHRYLDFLNPINASKNWELHLEYDFAPLMQRTYYAPDGETETTDDKPWNIVRYTNSHVETDQEEQVLDPPYDAERDEANNQYDTLDPNYNWDADDEEIIDEDTIREYKQIPNFTPDNVQFQICTPDGTPLNADGVPYDEGDDNGLIWSCSDLGLTTSNTSCLITLYETKDELGLTLNNRSYTVLPVPGGKQPTYVSYTNTIHENVDSENKRSNPILPDDCYLEIYDHVAKKILFRTCINRSIGTVHPEVLDFGFNIDNIQCDVDEADVYTGVAPVLQYNKDGDSSTDMTRPNFTSLVTDYQALGVAKGDRIPMILQKVMVTADTLEAAKRSLGGYTNNSGKDESTNISSNYWARPYKPQDQPDTSDSTKNKWEFWKATAYWYAPYTKFSNDFEVFNEETQGIEYPLIFGRPDTRDEKGIFAYNKIGTTESSDENRFAIYNQCALYLKDHSAPKVELDVDVANLQGGKYNDYNLHDKVYIKLPGTSELITAKVVETSKEANDIASNTVKLSNYTNNVLKQITNETIIRAVNTSFKYPDSKKLTVRLENLDYDEDDPYSIQYPVNKLISFTLYSVKDGQKTFKKIYTKKTDAYGYASINMKYDPGTYAFDISFGGDEEYSQTTSYIKISVGGVKEVKQTKKDSKKNKTTKTRTKKVTTYYDKYGRSPDHKKILAIGLKSAGRDSGSPGVFYATEFKNKCPACGSGLYWDIFYAGNEYSNWGHTRYNGNNEGGSAEGHIFCTNPRCDKDFSCQGYEHGYDGMRLKVTKARKKSSKTDAYKLRKGKYVYGTKTVKVKQNNNSNTKTRKTIGKISNKIKQKALSIVGNKTGYSAMRAICSWMDKNVHYVGYGGFQRSPEYVLTHGGNCCDQTRLIFQLFDGAGVCEYYDLYYVNLSCPSYGHVYGRIRSKKTKNWINVDPASDDFGCYGYVCDSCSRTSPVDSKYPNKPF